MSLREHFPFPISLAMCSRRQGGKTFFLKKLIGELYDDYKQIYVFSPTCELDPTFDDLRRLGQEKKNGEDKTDQVATKKEKKKNPIRFISENILEIADNVFESNSPENRILFVFDDITNYYGRGNNDLFSKLALKSRHYGISIIFTSHEFKRLNTLVRTNMTQKLFFKINNLAEMRKICEECCNINVDEDALRRIIEENTGNYHCVLITNGPEADTYHQLKA